MESPKTYFYSKLFSIEETKAKNKSSLLHKQEYDAIKNCLVELKSGNTTRSSRDNRLMRKYEIQELAVEGTIVTKQLKKINNLRFVYIPSTN